MSPLTFGCPVWRVSAAVRGSAPLLCCPTAAGSRWAPLPGTPWGKGVCAPSQRAAYGNTCLHGFISGPSLSSLLPEEQHLLLVRACGRGLPTKALPLLTTLPHGAPCRSGCSSASLVHGSDRLSIWWHRWQVTLRTLLWVTGGL